VTARQPLLRREAWPLAVAAAAFTVAVGLTAADSDMWWHLASGRWIVEHRDALRVDIFSSTAAGIPYDLGEWLGQVLLYLAYAGGSWTGLAILRAICVAVAAFAVTRSALRSAPSLVAVPLAVAAVVMSMPIWTDTPQLFTLALFPLVLDLLLSARSGSRAALIAVVPVLFLWSDLHIGYAVGLALLWLFALEAALSSGALAGILSAAAISTVALTLNPGALSLPRAAGHLLAATPGIVETMPVDPLTPFGALFALVLGLVLFSFLRSGASLLGALVVVPTLLLALTAQRHIPLFGFAAVPFVAKGLGDLIARTPTPGAGAPVREARNVARPSARYMRMLQAAPGIVLALWVGAVGSIAITPRAPDLAGYPVGALDQLRASSGVVLNEYDWGGYLIWTVPGRPVFIDGRLFPFVIEGVDGDYRETVALRPRWRSVIERRNVIQVLLRPDRPVAAALREDGWLVVSEGRGYVLLERP